MLYLQNWKNPKKTEIIKKNNKVYITCFSIIDTVAHKGILTYYNGKIVSLKPQEIELKIDMEMFSNGRGKNLNNKTIYYEISDSLSNTEKTDIRNININTISSIDCYSFKNNSISQIGIGLLVTSLTYAIFAPLTCINYKNGDFNNKLYYKSLAACGIGFSLGLSVAIIFNNNKFFSISNNPPPDTKYNNIYKIEIR